MVKETIKIYLENKDKQALLSKANETGFVGRGSLSHFLSFLAQNEILFLDGNVRKLLKVLDLK